MQKLIITPASQKKHMLKKLEHEFIPFKLMSMEELEQQFFFSYAKQAIYELMRKEGISYSVAVMYLKQLKNLHYSEELFLKREKIESIKSWLIESELLQFNPNFLSYLSQMTIEVSGYCPLKKEEQNLLELVKKITQVELLKNEDLLHKPIVYEAKTMEDEVLFVIQELRKQYESGIPYKDMQIIYDETYQTTIERLFHWFQIPLNHTSTIAIYGTVLWKQVKTILEKETSFEKVNDAFEQLIPTLSILEQEMLLKIISICNQYAMVPLDQISRICIEEEVKQIRFEPNMNELGVRICSIDEMDTGITFLLGFNQGIIPTIKTDIDFFTDIEKRKLNLSPSYEQNTILKERLKQLLFRNSNSVISYKKQSPFESFYPSFLIEEWQLEVRKANLESIYSYSHVYNQMKYAESLDLQKKFNIKSKILSSFQATYPNFSYQTYNNQFTGVDSNKLVELWNHKLLLSYSHIDHFYRCGFRYYIAHVLHLEDQTETFSLLIGNLFHFVLSKAFLPEFEFETCWSNFLIDKSLTKKEQHFLKNLKENLKYVIEVIQKQDLYSDYKQALYEEKIYIKKDYIIPVTFMGVIDKLKYLEQDGVTNVAVIDYKTGNPNTNLNNVIYGLEMQLPVYLYLAQHLNQLPNIRVTGFYLQKILNKELAYDPSKTYEVQKQNQLKLDGYSTSEEERLNQFDHTYQASEMIQGMKLSKNGFYSYSKVLDPIRMDRLLKITEQKIEESIKEILNGNFQINPKRIGGDKKGCEYCPFKDLCYVQERNFIDLEEYKKLEFLGGEENGE